MFSQSGTDMDKIISLLIFLLIFGVLVISHEGGHFLIARANGIRVREFTIGLGPQIFHTVKKGTVFSVRLFPFGGACIFDGMLDDEETEDDFAEDKKTGGFFFKKKNVAAESQTEDTRRDRDRESISKQSVPTLDMNKIARPAGSRIQTSDDGEESEDEQQQADFEAQGVPFPEAKVWARIATILAGPLFNFIVGFLIALVVTAFTPWDYPVVSGFTENSAAQAAGLKEGDLILRMNGDRITMAQEVSLNSQFNTGEDIKLLIERDGKEETISFTPSYDAEQDRYYMGVYIGKYDKVEGAAIIPRAFDTVRYYIVWTYRSLGLLITGRLGADALSGPVGMAQMVDETYVTAASYGISAVLLSMLELALLLSVNLGVMNLLPIPALDGGRLLFLLIELIRGKPVPPEKESYVNMAGMILLVALMAFVLFNDIMKLIR